MEPRPLVSVVIPTYQRARVLEEAVRSALAQTYDRLEVLVEDDGSTDGTDRMVAALGDPRVRYAWAPNAGYPAPVRNRAIRRAQGELVAFLDSDDVWAPRLLARAVAALLGDPSLLAVSCRANTIPPTRSRGAFVPNRRPSFHEVLRHGGGILNSAVVRREVFDVVGLLDEDREIIEDLDLWLRVLRHRDRSVLVLGERLFGYRDSPDSMSRGAHHGLERLRPTLRKHEDVAADVVRQAFAERELALRRAELLARFRGGELPLLEWLRASEVPLRRRIRVAARSALRRRARA